METSSGCGEDCHNHVPRAGEVTAAPRGRALHGARVAAAGSLKLAMLKYKCM
jgi:hypothetical protein